MPIIKTSNDTTPAIAQDTMAVLNDFRSLRFALNLKMPSDAFASC